MKVLSAVVMAGLVVSSCGQGTPVNQNLTPIKVKVSVVRTEPVGAMVEGWGTLDFKKKVELSAPVEGVVEDYLVSEGDKVRKGEVLVRLANPQLEMRKAQADAALAASKAAVTMAEALVWEARFQVRGRWISWEQAGIELEQKRLEADEASRTLALKTELFEAGGIAVETLNGLRMTVAAQKSALVLLEKEWKVKSLGLRDEDLLHLGKPIPLDPEEKLDLLVDLNTQTVRAGVESAAAKVESTRQEAESVRRLLEGLEVRSPLDGVVGARDLEEGELASPGARLLTVIETSSLVAVIPVQGAEGFRIGEGMQAEVTVDPFTSEKLVSKVSWVSPLVDQGSRSLTFKVPVPNPGAKLKPGMFARVKVATGVSVPSVILPANSVVRKTGTEAVVYVVSNKRIVGRNVELSQDLGGRFVVTRGLAPGDLAVEDPSPLLKEGDLADVS